ncbi:MAG TPA: 50S ribosomal protein L18e [Candidatus Nanoarchaeia archaeon]|nr:50S ribosomal protein L18e [Candidatus Nanoarchaeia archaeon]
MSKRTGPSTLELQNLIVELKKAGREQKVPLWLRIAADLERPRRIRREVNLYTLQESVREGETAIVPGKVLSLGEFNKKNIVAAYKFSESAEGKINKTGKAISIQELLKKNPKGNKVRIIG